MKNKTRNLPKKSGWYWVRYHEKSQWEMKEITIDDLGRVTMYVSGTCYLGKDIKKKYPYFERSICRYEPPK